MKIVSYVEVNADKFRSKTDCSQLSIDFSKEFNPEQYEVIEELKRNNPEVVRCIPLDDINYFSLTMKPTEKELKILEENGFVFKGVDAYGNDFYARKELLSD